MPWKDVKLKWSFAPLPGGNPILLKHVENDPKTYDSRYFGGGYTYNPMRELAGPYRADDPACRLSFGAVIVFTVTKRRWHAGNEVKSKLKLTP